MARRTPSAVPSAVPVVVLAGFLGAGKTTLLNHLLRARTGRRIGVLVNDFGSVGVDALAVAGQVDALVELGNGCLCCAVDVAGLDAMLARLVRPAHRLDAVVIEASGLAEPRELVRQVLSSTNPAVTYGGLVTVVDAEHLDTLRRAHPHVDGQFAVADLVVLNRCDRVEAATLAGVHDLTRRVAGGRPVVVTSHGRVDPALLFGAAGDLGRGTRPAAEQLSLDELRSDLPAPDLPAPDGPVAHLHTAYTHVDVELERPLHPGAFLAFLESRPPGLYRTKGFVTFATAGPRRTFAVHTVGDHLTFERAPAVPGAGGGSVGGAAGGGARLELIGVGLDEPALRAQLAACVATSPVPASDGALGRVLVLAGAARR